MGTGGEEDGFQWGVKSGDGRCRWRRRIGRDAEQMEEKPEHLGKVKFYTVEF